MRSPADVSLLSETLHRARAYTPGMFTKHRLAEVAALFGQLHDEVTAAGSVG